LLAGIDIIDKEDLDLPNHLIGMKRKYLKLRFYTVDDLMKAKRDIMPVVKRNKEREKSKSVYDPSMFTGGFMQNTGAGPTTLVTDQLDNIVDIREYDVPYHIRVAIDNRINVGHWYRVKGHNLEAPEINLLDDQPDRPEPVVLAFDIETTKLPLKFPDPTSDVVMMISYMIDGHGYLLTNREIVGGDVEDFEYTPKPEYQGPFTVYNEPNEVSLLQRFFDHVIEVQPNIIVTYNGDVFDWPFLDARAEFHHINMLREIGFAADSQNEFKCRSCIHMDAFRWVKRDSYLPVGSQNLKATTKAKLRYDPVELDPEDMCRLACEQPQVLANYSVSDAVATYYLYMKYVHPFIFALCTIIPMEPDEVLRKGSGTLCEALLMVQAYHGNIIFPNKQESILNKLTDDGHVLDTETYVGGHVEALESGVFRSDIPSRFKLSVDMLQSLADGVKRTMGHALEIEEKVPLEDVTNFDEVCDQIIEKLLLLKATPIRSENPMIYHLDVGAMYPNIILTNRLQPPAIVDEITCASCDFNKPGATCQRKMDWKWRGDYLPASRNEHQSIRLQLESETFPGYTPSDPSRTFHQMSAAEQAAIEKKRLTEYCRKAYKRVKLTREELRTTTVCQRENSFYVDTVRAFRDRRYEFKGLLKVWKKKLDVAKQNGDPAEIKSCQNKEILYDSLQLAHKCILNSFYGYVMRRGARWYSMEMAGIVCYTGSCIIRRAREIVEQIGRPLELDTDGIWCILPSSFPENFEFMTTNSKRSKVTISYPGAMLNIMLQDHFTNDQYQKLVNQDKLEYEQISENSIFFEVDGPYKAMILPASKEEGKKLKKRYAVFNQDNSLAELKGFEVKRRGELQLIKNFQSSVFETFLNGTTLQECYDSVATVANFWLDVLYSHAANMPDSELFDLISENRSMSRKLEDYGQQKSTSISTAKRLAEFLGDQMVKDAGLSCRFIIARRPEGSPVTERAIPLAIFQANESVCKHYLCKWLKCSTYDNLDIRSILDWDYYIERLGNAIQKIITIPAAMQGVSNPVPRIAHPDWLHKRLLEKNDVCKQQKINELFSVAQPKSTENDNTSNDGGTPDERGSKRSHDQDIEDVPNKRIRKGQMTLATVITSGYTQSSQRSQRPKTWREALGPPPQRGTTKEEFMIWLQYHKKKWQIQKTKRRERQDPKGTLSFLERPSAGNMSSFLRQKNHALAKLPWQLIQLVESSTPGRFVMWVLVDGDLHQLSLNIPRMFYVNSRTPKELENDTTTLRGVSKILPRATPVFNLYEYSVPEPIFREHSGELVTQLSSPDIEGVYESNIPLVFRGIVSLGCVCSVNKQSMKDVINGTIDDYKLTQLDYKTVAQFPYLEDGSLKLIYLYQSMCGARALYGLFFMVNGKAHIFGVDTVRTNQMPNFSHLYQNERNFRLTNYGVDYPLPPEEFSFDVRIEVEHRRVYRHIQRLLTEYKDSHHGPTVVLIQSKTEVNVLNQSILALSQYPVITLPTLDSDSNYSTLDWQRPVAKRLITQFLNIPTWFHNQLEQARYAHVPVGNIPSDTAMFVADVFYSRHLIRHNHITWATPTDQPDLGGHEHDDYRLMMEANNGRSLELNNPGLYPSMCIELSLDGLAVTAVLQASHINDYEGASGTSISFDYVPQASLEELMDGSAASILSVYDEAALCSGAFKILRGLVYIWLHEVSTRQNYYADLQLQHFYRWISSPNSLLYEPALCRTIHKMMSKLFMQLVGEFNKLGSTIVYADFTRIVLCTKKRKVEDVCAYIEFVLKSIQSRDLYHSLQFEPKNCWNLLLWMDKANYGGIGVPLPDHLTSLFKGIDDDGRVHGSMDDGGTEDHGYDLVMNWNIGQYLPTDCRDIFKAITAAHIQAIYKKIIEIQTNHDNGSSSSTQFNDSSLTAGVISFAQNRIEKEISEKLFLMTQQIRNTLGVDVSSREDIVFPNHPGSHLDMKNPALEFVKCLCKVLSLDSTTQHQVTKLKRDLLKLIGIREFSEEAVFVDPCCSYVLSEVICENCNSCRDIDMCRDQYTIYNEELDL
jgi:DNA polymerase epsilon subunit 1